MGGRPQECRSWHGCCRDSPPTRLLTSPLAHPTHSLQVLYMSLPSSQSFQPPFRFQHISPCSLASFFPCPITCKDAHLPVLSQPGGRPTELRIHRRRDRWTERRTEERLGFAAARGPSSSSPTPTTRPLAAPGMRAALGGRGPVGQSALSPTGMWESLQPPGESGLGFCTP